MLHHFGLMLYLLTTKLIGKNESIGPREGLIDQEYFHLSSFVSN